MGLLIDDQGIPVSYELFPGNTNHFKTLEPALTRLKEQYGIKKLILVADRDKAVSSEFLSFELSMSEKRGLRTE